MHSEEVHVEAGQSCEGGESVEEQGEEQPDNSIVLQCHKVPVELRDISSWHVWLWGLVSGGGEGRGGEGRTGEERTGVHA